MSRLRGLISAKPKTVPGQFFKQIPGEKKYAIGGEKFEAR